MKLFSKITSSFWIAIIVCVGTVYYIIRRMRR